MGEKSNFNKENIFDTLEQGVQNVFSSERYIKYLTFLGKFHSYSWRNSILVFQQKPEATFVAGFNDWKNKHKRYVKKGEKAIKIVAPYYKKFQTEVNVLDNHGNPVIVNGKNLTEKKEIEKMLFRVVSVFDVSQTAGEPIPRLTYELQYTVKNYQELFTAISSFSECPIKFEDIVGGTKGYFDFTEQRIAINNGMSEAQTIKTAIHELTHSRLHNPNTEDKQENLSRYNEEVQAESVAFVVSNHFGIDTSDYSFNYIASWSSGKELEELHQSLEIIQKEANIIIQGIEEQYQQLLKDRNIEINNTEKGVDRDMDGIDDNRDSSYTAKIPVPDLLSKQQMYTLEQAFYSSYQGEKMLPILLSQAELFQEYVDIPLYRLYSDGSKALVEKNEKLFDEALYDSGDSKYANGGFFGVEEADWQTVYKQFIEPQILIEWSESNKLSDGQRLSLAEANTLFKSVDLATAIEYEQQGLKGAYDKTKYVLFYTEENTAKIMIDRQDFGDGDGSLINHIKLFNPGLGNYLYCHNDITQLYSTPNINTDILNSIRNELNAQPMSTETLEKINDKLITEITPPKNFKKQEYSKGENARTIADIKQSIPIHEYAQQMGFTVQRVGNYYTLKEHDSVRINPNKNVFTQNSTGVKGSIIDFVMHFENIDKAAAIDKLAKYIGADTKYSLTPIQNSAQKFTDKEKTPLVLPEKAKTMKNIFAYLINTRKIDSQIVNHWVRNGNLYQDTHNNCVFVTVDKYGKANFASQKGTNTSKPFQADVKGSDYNCCHFINNNAKSLIVCEAVIDLMSVQTILKANGRNLNNYNYLSLNGVSKTHAILNALQSSNTDTVILATDNDKSGEQARSELRELASKFDKNIKFINYVPKNEKDWNAELVSNVQRETTTLSNQKEKLSEKITDCQNKADEHNKMIENNKSQSLAQKRNVPNL